MTNEELILEKLERLETQIQPLIKTSEKFAELKNDLIPIGNHATSLLIKELN
jgi:archaellum component FlaC